MHARKRSILERLLSGTLALALAASGILSNISVARATAAPELPAATVSVPASQPTSPTVVRELTDKRTETSKELLLSDGTIRAQYFANPVHYRDPATKSMKAIDATLRETTDDGRPVSVNRANRFRVELPHDLADDEVSIETSGTKVSLKPRWKNRSGAARVTTGAIEARSVSATDRVYPEAFVGAALEYESRADGVKETIVLAKRGKANVFGFELSLVGLTPRVEPDGSVTLLSVGTTEAAYSIPAPFMMDSSGSTVGDDYTDAVHYDITGTGPSYQFDVVADAAWLADPARVYPVRIDPSFVAYGETLAKARDTFTSSKSTNQAINYQWHPALWVNTNNPAANWTEYTFCQPGSGLVSDMATKKAQGLEVVGSRLGLYVYTIARPGSVSGIMCSTTVPTYLAQLNWNLQEGGVPATVAGYSTPFVTAVLNTRSVFDVTNMVAYWQDAAITWDKCTVRLSSNPATKGQIGYRAADYASNQPLWEIDYAAVPEVDLTSPAVGTQSASAPEVSWAYSEPRTTFPQVEYNIQVALSKTAAPIASANAISPSAQAPMPVPAGGFLPDTTYYVRVQVASSPASAVPRLWSPWSAWGDFTLPPAPVSALSVSTTSSARWFRESVDAGGRLHNENNHLNEGRGSLAINWSPSAGATGYRVLMSDGAMEREIGRTFGNAATSLSTSGLGAYPLDRTLADRGALGSGQSPFGANPLESSTLQQSFDTALDGAGVVVTDGTDLYVHRWGDQPGPTGWTRVESGLSTGIAGVVTGQGQTGTPSRNIGSAAYLGGFIFEGSAVTPTTLEGIHKTKTMGESDRGTLTLSRPLLMRHAGVEVSAPTGDVMIAGDDRANTLYSISTDRSNTTASFLIRKFAVSTNTTGTYERDAVVVLPGQINFSSLDGAFTAEGNLYLIEGGGKNRVVRIDTRTWKATGSWESATGGPSGTHLTSACYEPISRTVFAGWNDGTMARFTGPGADLRDNPAKLYEATPGTANDPMGGYFVRVVPFNAQGLEPSLYSNAGVWTTLDSRTVAVGQDPRHTVASLGSVAGDQANARLDRSGRALTLDRTDLAIESWGPAAALTRHYSSDDTSTGYLSPGWSFGFEQRLLNASADAVLITYVDKGSERHVFEKKSGVWFAPNGLVADIAFEANLPIITTDDRWTIAFKDRTKLVFDSSGRLMSESDRNGQTVTYTFADGSVQIMAANGQSIDVVLDGGKATGATHTIDGAPTARSVSYASSGTGLSVDYFPNSAEDAFTVEYGYAGQRIASAEVTGAVLAGGAGRWDMEYGASGGLETMTAPVLAHSQERPQAVFEYALDATTGSDVATITRSAVISGDRDATVSVRYVANPTGTMAYVTNWRTPAEPESRWNYSYSAANETVQEISPMGKQVSRVLDSRSNVLFEYDEERHATTYEYDAMDQVTQQTDARGCATYFRYDMSGNMVSKERVLNETQRARDEYEYDDPRGLLTLSRTLLSADRWIATKYAEFARSSGEPQRTEQLAQIKTADGVYQSTTMSLSSTATAASIVTTCQIDQFGQVEQQSDAGGLTIMTGAVYSPAGKLKRSSDVEGVVTHNVYGALGDLIETSQTVNATSGPDFTNWRSYEVDAYGRTVRESNLGAGGVENTWVSHTFDAAGNEIATGGSIAGTSTAWFDARGEMTAQWAPDAGAATAGNTQSASRRVMNADGVELAVIAAGRPATDATTKEWRPDGLLLKTTSPDKSWVRFEYDDGGLQTAVISPAEDGSESIARTYYDIGGRQVRNEPDEGVITKNAYDLAGRLIKNSTVQITGEENQAGEWIETEVETTSTVNTYNELGWMLSTTGADGVRKMRGYDALGNVVEESSFASGAITPTTVVSTSYDAKKRITRQTTTEAGGDSVVAFAYDAFGRITSEKHLKGALTKKNVETAYDEFGRERLVTDSKTGVTTSFVYAGGSNKKSTVRMAYGSLTTTSSTDEKGRNATQTATFDLGGGVRDLTRSLTWDRTKNLVTSARLQTDAGDSSMVYAYDSTDKLTSLTGGAWGTGGLSVSYNTTGTASKTSDTVTVPWSGSNVVANRIFGYTQSGRLSTVTAGSRETLYSWNASGTGDLEGIRDGGVVTKLDYAAGHISTLTVDGQRTTFAFDAAGRRILESSPTGSLETSWTANDRQLSWTAKDSGGGTVRSAAYGYDGDGQRLTATVLAPSPWSVTATQTAYSYAYDGLALRRMSAESEGASATLTYLYGSGDVPYAGSYEATAGGAATSTVFQVLSTDHGDVVALADEAGDVFARYTYGPFGEAEGIATRETPLIPAETAAAIAQANPLRYAGYCFDTWSGDYYLQARYYDPSTRQFLSKDPAEADGEESAYQYCGGDPIQATDATGEAADYTGSGKMTVANSNANAARRTANKRLSRLWMQRAVEAERRERAHRVYVQKLANARIARQKAAAAKLRIAQAAAAKKKRIASLKAQVAASQREAKKYAAQAKRWQFASDATVVTAVVAVTWLTAGTVGPIAASYLVAYGAGGAAATGVGSAVARELTDGDDMEARIADKVTAVTGRGAENVREQLAIREAISSHGPGRVPLPIRMNDTANNFMAKDGWSKYQSIHRAAISPFDRTSAGNINIHYIYNSVTGTFADAKVVRP